MDTAHRFRAAMVCLLLLVVASSAVAQRRKVIVDQDARGPATTDIQSILVFLQSPDVDVLGLTLTSGDQWVTEETLHTLRVAEIAGRTDVPVVPGAVYSLLNTTDEAQWWERQYGQFRRPYPLRLRPPDAIPEFPEGKPTSKPLDEHAANFIVRMVRKYPHEVTVWAGGPLTNIALALKLDPEIAALAKELVLMGGGFYVTDGGLQQGNSRREFNWWWDPEAVRITMSAPWKKITITPIDISVKTRLSDELKADIAKADAPVARYLTQFSRASYMWDEISAIAFLDPSIITKQEEFYVNIDIDHGPSYGQTIFVDKGAKVPSWWKLATVQWDLDTTRFYKAYADLMKRPAPAR